LQLQKQGAFFVQSTQKKEKTVLVKGSL